MVGDLEKLLSAKSADSIRRTAMLMFACAALDGVVSILLADVLLKWLTLDKPPSVLWQAAMAGSIVIFCCISYLSYLRGYKTSAALLGAVLHAVEAHIPKLPLGWFSQNRIDQLSSLSAGDVMEVISIPAHLMKPFFNALVTPAVLMLGVLMLDWRLAVPMVFVTVSLVVILRWGTRISLNFNQQRRAAEAELSSRILEFGEQQATIRSAGQDNEACNHLYRAIDARSATLSRLINRSLPGILGFSVGLQTLFLSVMCVGVWFVKAGTLQPATLVAALVLTIRMMDSLQKLANLDIALQSARLSIEKIEDILLQRPLPLADKPVHPKGYSVEMRRVSFGLVLKNIEFVAPERSLIAVVGASGAGKSTLVSLLARFNDVDSGSIKIGGVDIRDMTSQVLNTMVCVAVQHSLLLDADLESNIAVGNPQSGPLAVREAARLAGVSQFVDELPQGWKTRLGPEGASLSEGQRQRINLARAFLSSAPIVVLDEPTANLDPHSEELIVRAIARLNQTKTVLVISHRPNCVRNADTILILERGKIQATGTHQALVATNPWYQQFVCSDDVLSNWTVKSVSYPKSNGAALP